MKRTKQPISEMAPKYDNNHEPIVLSKPLLDKLLKGSNPSDLIALYCFYYYTAKWQKTNQPKATDSYCMKGLQWGESRFRTAKKQLLDLQLIKQIQVINESNKIIGWYVHVNFIWKRSNVFQNSRNGGLVPEHLISSTGNERINALSPNNVNALNSNIIRSNPPTPLLTQITPSHFDLFWSMYPNKDGKGKAHKSWNLLCNKKDRPLWETLRKAIRDQNKTDRWKKGFIPLASTWINQTRWEDDPELMMDKKFKKSFNTTNDALYNNADIEVYENN